MRRDPLVGLASASAATHRAIETDALTNPEAIEATIAAQGALLAGLRVARVDAEIRRFVADRPGATCNAIALGVRGDKRRTLTRIKALADRGVLYHESGSQGRQKWYLEKTGTGLSTALRRA